MIVETASSSSYRPPIASSSRHTHSPASSSSDSEARGDGALAGSLLREDRQDRDAEEGSPATSAEGPLSSIRSPRRTSSHGEDLSRQHRKTPRRRSSSSSDDGGHAAEQRMAAVDARPTNVRRKTPRLDDEHSSPMRNSFHASPEVPRSPRRRRRINLATFPVSELLRPLADLLQQIAQANDAQSAVRNRGMIPSSSASTSSDVGGAGPSGYASPPLVPPSTPARDLSAASVDPFLPAGPFSTTTSPAVTRVGSTVALRSLSRQAYTSHQDIPKLIVEEELFTASRNVIRSPSSSMAFHARNIPSISIEAYLTRILKYCPTTCDVFVSLLVFFDRMAQVVEDSSRKPMVLDSYNIHRLLIAGVAVSSKFYSDVFYTNSRYAKVGGLPVAELNTLELQFLCLNDFKLLVPVEELERYGTQLLTWAGLEDLAEEVIDEDLESDSMEPFMGADETMMDGSRGERRPASGSTDASGTSTIRAHARAASELSENPVEMDED